MLRMGQEPEQAMTQLFWGSRDREIFTELGSLGHRGRIFAGGGVKRPVL